MLNKRQVIQDAFDALTVEDQQQSCVTQAKFLAESYIIQKSIEEVQAIGRQAHNTLGSFGVLGTAMASLAPPPMDSREPDCGFWRIKSMISLIAESSTKLENSADPEGPLKAKEIMAQRRVHGFLEVCYSTISA